MSGATLADVGAARSMLVNSGLIKQVAPDASDKAETPMSAWMSPRQMRLNWLWAQFRTEQYNHCRVDWNGHENLQKGEGDFVATAGYLPAGFYDAGQTLPYKFRKPTAPVHLVKLIVKRFTSLLFSSMRHPRVTCPEDDDTSDWIGAAITDGRLWAHMITARDYGGATGSVAMSFRFQKGKVQFEVHDPRFCTPVFEDKSTGDLQSLEKRYMYTDHLRDEETGQWVEAQFWYRRVIDQESDTVWNKVPVYDGEEPDWARYPSAKTNHGFGECPAVWIQNKTLQEEIDGDPDCHGVYDLCWAIDALLSQAHTGTLKNCDPTLHIADSGEMDSIAKGSDNVIKTSEKGKVDYVELASAGGIDVAMKLADKLEDRVQMIARCHLDSGAQKEAQAKTATEVERQYSNMLEEADTLREQYGQGIKLLIEKLLRAARILATGFVDKSNPDVPKIVKQVVILPKKPIVDESTGKVTGVADRQLGQGQTIELHWPPYFTPSVTDVAAAVKAAGDAKVAGIVDTEHAARYVAPHFQVEDVPAMLQRAAAEEKQQNAQMEQEMMQRMNGGGDR